jgi:vacuolar protein sorting-associated protein 54
VKWDDSNAEVDPNAYMELLVKDTLTIHKVLNKYLPQETLQVNLTF